MVKQVVKTGNLGSDGTGDPARTAMQKINLNFTELYDFVGGAEGNTVLPLAMPMSRGGTGAVTAQAARQNLGLGDSAVKNIGTVEGDVMGIGTCGFGTDLSPLRVEADPQTPADFKSGELAYLNLPDTSVVTLGTREGASKGQLGIKGIGKAKTVPVFRGSSGAVFTRWYDVLTQANCIETVNGNIKYAENSMRVDAYNAVNQHGIAHPYSKLGVGVYLVSNATIDWNRWALEVPMDYLGNAQFLVALEQQGTAVKLTVTKNGAAYDVPVGQWIDVHLST